MTVPGIAASEWPGYLQSWKKHGRVWEMKCSEKSMELVWNSIDFWKKYGICTTPSINHSKITSLLSPKHFFVYELENNLDEKMLFMNLGYTTIPHKIRTT